MIRRVGMGCCNNEWREMVKQLWEKFQTVIQGIRMNGHAFYPDGDGIVDLKFIYKRSLITITPSEWDADTNEATISIDGMTTDNDVIIGPTPESWSVWGDSGIVGIVQTEDALVLRAQTIPTIDIEMQIVIL